MAEKRKRLLINAFLIVALISFVGISIAPLLQTALRPEPLTTEPSPTSQSNLPPDQQSVLREQAKGYELVLQREPENQTALRGLLDIRLQLGDMEGAIVPLERLAELNPDQPDYTVLLARAKQELGDREGAAEAYRTILTSNPGDLEALQGLANLLLLQNRPEAALGLLQDTLKLAEQVNGQAANGQIPEQIPGQIPGQTSGTMDVPSIKLILGQVYVAQQRYDEAIEIYDQISLADANDFRPLLAKAIVLKNRGDNEGAYPLLEQAAELAPPQYKDQIKQLASEAAGTVPSIPGSPEAGTGETNPDGSPETIAPESELLPQESNQDSGGSETGDLPLEDPANE